MRYGSGSGDGKNREHIKYECLISFMRRGSGTACGGVADFFPRTTDRATCAAATRHLQRKVGVVCLFCHFFLFNFLDSYQEVPKFPRAGNRDEGQLRKTEFKLYEVVIGTVFRPLLYGIVQPKALLSFGSSSLFFPP